MTWSDPFPQFSLVWFVNCSTLFFHFFPQFLCVSSFIWEGPIPNSKPFYYLWYNQFTIDREALTHYYNFNNKQENDTPFICSSVPTVTLCVLFLCSYTVPLFLLFQCVYCSSVPPIPLSLCAYCLSDPLYPLILCAYCSSVPTVSLFLLFLSLFVPTVTLLVLLLYSSVPTGPLCLLFLCS